VKIGIDVHSAHQRMTGIGVYTQNLVRGLQEVDGAHQYVFYGSASPRNLRTHQRIVRENAYLSMRSFMDKLDLLHIPGYCAPLISAGTLVVTVHDLIGMIFPENLALMSRFYWGTWLPTVVSRADRIIADSFNTKRDLIRLLGVAEEKIRVIHLAADPKFRPIRDELALHQVKRRFNLSRPFALYVGTVEPRKNLRRVIEAWAHLRREAKVSHQLVITGFQAWAYSEVSDLVHRLGIRRDVVFTGYVREEELPLLYNACELFIFPSLYEGFGMPVLESMACGTPVLTANTSSIPEVAGDAAVMVDPRDTDKMAEAMKEILEDACLRERLRKAGPLQAAKFSWRKTARETLEVYAGK
jgi:glycosyltransferase involved in cell wall biosynthesis